MEADLGQLDQAADAIIQRVGAYLHDGRGIHIETAIAAVGSLAGVAMLRRTGLSLPESEPGKVQVVLSEEANEQGAALVQFMSAACPILELDGAFPTTEIPPEHQPLKNMIEGVLEWVRDLEAEVVEPHGGVGVSGGGSVAAGVAVAAGAGPATAAGGRAGGVGGG